MTDPWLANVKKVENVGGIIRMYYDKEIVEDERIMDNHGQPETREHRTCNAIIKIGDDDGTAFYRGKSSCNPLDNFRKKVGRCMALGRAVSNMEKRIETDNLTAFELRMFTGKVKN